MKRHSEHKAHHKDGVPMGEPKQVLIPAALSIGSYIHCGKCIDQRPDGISPRDWAQLEIGFTKLGLQVWCKRHECNVVHIDFQGVKHPATMLTEETMRRIKP